MTMPKKGLQVQIVIPVTRPDGRGGWTSGPVKLVRKHKPRNGGGVTLAEFTNRDGDGVQRALDHAKSKGYDFVGMK